MEHNGVIYKAISGFYYIQSDLGVIECKARGKLRLDNAVPLVGDKVEFELIDTNSGIIKRIYQRKNVFVRPPIANIDLMVIVASVAVPITDLYLIDKMTVIANKKNCATLICINKSDLDSVTDLYDIYNKSGFKTIIVSALTGTGIFELVRCIANLTCAFTGNSGVGKSSILNAIDSDFNIKIGSINKKLGRGRHTTRHVELYKLPCGTLVADTPGFSAFDMDFNIPANEIQYLFIDFVPYLNECRFLDCAHINEPDCKVLEALKKGEIQQSRYNSYVRLYNQTT